MSTSVGSAKLLRSITHQLWKLSITGTGGRHIHLCTLTGVDTVLKRNYGPHNVLQTEARHVSGHCSNGIGIHSPPTISMVMRENKKIREKDKPKVTYDCPKVMDLEIDTPPSDSRNIPFDNPEEKQKIEESPESSLPAIQLKQKMRNRRKKQHITIIRHIKMKRHQLRRIRKRLYPIKKKEKFLRKKKQEREFVAYLDKLRSYGKEFDAEQYVKDRLEKAKRAGYQFDITPTVKMLKRVRE